MQNGPSVKENENHGAKKTDSEVKEDAWISCAGDASKGGWRKSVVVVVVVIVGVHTSYILESYRIDK